MATGASTADLAILLVDARHGVREQTRRHARIARLLGISHLVLAVNKMDLVGFDRARLRRRSATSSPPFADGAELHAIPLSALNGDNVIERERRDAVVHGPAAARIPRDRERRQVGHRQRRSGSRCSWWCGPTTSSAATPDRSPRARSAPGDRDHGLAVRPRRRGSSASSPGTATSTVAHAPMSVTLTLDDEVDVSRGDVLATTPLHVGPAASTPTSCGWTNGRSIRSASTC